MAAILRKAKTKGGKYSIEVINVCDTHNDIVHRTNGSVTARNCNIPIRIVNHRFDSIIRDNKLFDGINYIEEVKMAKFKTSEKIILPANIKEGWSEEQGVIIKVQDQNKYPGMYLVAVEPEDGNDDGIREVHEANIVKCVS